MSRRIWLGIYAAWGISCAGCFFLGQASAAHSLADNSPSGIRKAYERGKQEPSLSSFLQGMESVEEYQKKLWKPALAGFHHGDRDFPIAQVLILNNTPYKYTQAKITVNSQALGGGYTHSLGELKPGESWVLGCAQFVNANGYPMEGAQQVVSVGFLGFIEKELIVSEGTIFAPR